MNDAPQPLVSVVIPVFNGERYLGEAIESTLSQDYEPLEIIVVDDGSEDNSAAVAAAFQGVEVISFDANRGPAAARNAGINRASGEFIAMLDSDDTMLPGRLRAQADALLADPEAGLVISAMRMEAAEGVSIPEWFAAPVVTVSQYLPFDNELGYEPMQSMARAEVAREIGPFAEDMRYGEDLDWTMRFFESLHRVILLPRVLGVRRYHAGNATHNTDGLRRGILTALKRRIDRKRAREST